MWLPALFLAAHRHEPSRRRRCSRSFGAVVIWLVRRPLRKRTGRAAAIGAVGVRCSPRSGSLPLAATLKYTTDMRYEPIGPGTPILAARTLGRLPRLDVPVGDVVPLPARARGDRRRDLVPPPRHARSSSRSTWPRGLVFYDWEGLRDVFGKAPAWNLRLLPFWYLMLYLLAALGAAEIARWIGQFVAWLAQGSKRGVDAEAIAPVAGTETAAPVADPEPPLDDAEPALDDAQPARSAREAA